MSLDYTYFQTNKQTNLYKNQRLNTRKMAHSEKLIVIAQETAPPTSINRQLAAKSRKLELDEKCELLKLISANHTIKSLWKLLTMACSIQNESSRKIDKNTSNMLELSDF